MSEEEFKNIEEYSELCEEFSKEAVDAFVDWGSELFTGSRNATWENGIQKKTSLNIWFRKSTTSSETWVTWPTISTMHVTPVTFLDVVITTMTTASFSDHTDISPLSSFKGLSRKGWLF